MKETCRNLVRRNLVRSVDQREDLQIQKENTGKENRMLNWVRAGYGLTRIILRSLSALSLDCSDQREHNITTGLFGLYMDWRPV
jgi:hypothetical protein